MADLPRVADLDGYLAGTGWRRLPDTFNGAALWARDPGDHEVLVPPSDSLGDSDRRKRAVLRVLAEVERRPAADITRDIGSPAVDTVTYRTHPAGLPSGSIRIADGLAAMKGIDSMFESVDRIARRRAGPGYGDPRGQVRLGPTYPGSYVFTVHVPVAPGSRGLVTALYEAVAAAQRAAAAGDPAAFRDAGLPRRLCQALAGLAGDGSEQPFEIGFQWAHGVPGDLPARTVAFEPGAGRALRRAAERPPRPAATAPTSVTGQVEDLHDTAGGADRFRIMVRESGRTAWFRLPDGQTYAAAVAAHRDRARVRLLLGTGIGTGRATDPYRPQTFTVLD